jgi:outer membrane lipoprotein-sorting protein
VAFSASSATATACAWRCGASSDPFTLPTLVDKETTMNLCIPIQGRLLAAALSLAALLPAQAQKTAPPEPDTLMQQSRDRPDGSDIVSDTQLVMVDDRGGKRVRDLIYLQKDFGRDEKLTLYFLAPGDVKGVGFQSATYDEKAGKDDDQWIYLPAFRQVRRIASADKRGSFMGSEYAYIDLEKLRVNDYKQRITGEEEVLGRRCWVVERTPVSDAVIARTGYHKTVVWVDADSKLVLKQTYYDAKNVLFKTMTVQRVEKIQDIWTVMHSDMTDHVTGKTSSLVFSNVRYSVSLPDSLFQQSVLQTGVSRGIVSALR